jgi:hypothetical protein
MSGENWFQPLGASQLFNGSSPTLVLFKMFGHLSPISRKLFTFFSWSVMAEVSLGPVKRRQPEITLLFDLVTPRPLVMHKRFPLLMFRRYGLFRLDFLGQVSRVFSDFQPRC